MILMHLYCGVHRARTVAYKHHTPVVPLADLHMYEDKVK